MVGLNAAPPAGRRPVSLERHFVRLFLLAVVLPLFALMLFTLWRTREQRLEQLGKTMAAVSDAGRTEIDDLLQMHLAALQLLAERRSRERPPDDEAAWAAELADLRRHYPAFISALVTDADGWVRVSDPQPPAHGPQRRSVADRSYFHTPARTLRSHVSDGFRGRTLGTDPLVALSAPLLAADGRFAGVVEGSIRIASFATLRSGWLRARGFELLLVDRTGTVLSASAALPFRPLDRLPHPLPWHRLTASEAATPPLLPGLLRDGDQAYARGRRLDNGWGLVLLMPKRRVDAELWHNAISQLGLLGIAMLGVLAIVSHYLRRQRRSVQDMLERMHRFALGQSATVAARDMPEELAPLAEALARLSERANRSWDEVNRSLQEQSRLHEELQAVTRRLMAVQEDERRTLSRELHDDVGQSITAMKLAAQWLADADPEQRKAAIAEIVAIADQTIAKLRNLSLLLRPPQLDALGLEVALRSQAEALARATPTKIELQLDSLPVRPPPAVELDCFRIAQEAMTNALRHAQARRVTVSLVREADALRLEVSDDGRGIGSDRTGGLGLAVMRERAQQLGGMLDIVSGPAGTLVRARIPLPPPAASA